MTLSCTNWYTYPNPHSTGRDGGENGKADDEEEPFDEEHAGTPSNDPLESTP